jgi:RNA polymerase sigma-70 factor, ECF subfamily
MGQHVSEELDEHTLMTRIARGDQDALDLLYVRHRPRLWRYVWQQLDHHAEWAEEVVQDTFFAVWTSAQGYRGECSVATWIFRIAHHQTQKAWRTQGRQVQKVAIDDDLSLLVPIESHEAGVVARLSLAEALAHLSSKHRAVLELLFVHGFTLEEVALILDIPSGTVKSRLSYARRALHLELSRIGAQEDAHDA